MKCANPDCERSMLYLRGGTLRLLEQECHPASRLRGEGDGFPVYTRPVRFFWLCPECSAKMSVRRWTGERLLLEPRKSMRASLKKDPAGLRSLLGVQAVSQQAV